jgi:hypothetical protein
MTISSCCRILHPSSVPWSNAADGREREEENVHDARDSEDDDDDDDDEQEDDDEEEDEDTEEEEDPSCSSFFSSLRRSREIMSEI